MRNFAIMTTIELVKNTNTKTTFIEEERETEQITEQTISAIVIPEGFKLVDNMVYKNGLKIFIYFTL